MAITEEKRIWYLNGVKDRQIVLITWQRSRVRQILGYFLALTSQILKWILALFSSSATQTMNGIHLFLLSAIFFGLAAASNNALYFAASTSNSWNLAGSSVTFSYTGFTPNTQSYCLPGYPAQNGWFSFKSPIGLSKQMLHVNWSIGAYGVSWNTTMNGQVIQSLKYQQFCTPTDLVPSSPGMGTLSLCLCTECWTRDYCQFAN